AKELESEQGAEGVGSGDHLRAWEAGLAHQAIEGHSGQDGQEEEETAELGVQGAGLQVQLVDVSDVGQGGPCAGGSFVVVASWQAGEAFLLEDVGDGHRPDRLVGLVQGATDVINGEVLLAQGNNLAAQAVRFGSVLRSFGWGEKEGSLGFL